MIRKFERYEEQSVVIYSNKNIDSKVKKYFKLWEKVLRLKEEILDLKKDVKKIIYEDYKNKTGEELERIQLLEENGDIIMWINTDEQSHDK